MLQAVHLVRCGGKEQDTALRPSEELLSQKPGVIVAAKEVFEALELVENHQIRFETHDTGRGQDSPQLADYKVPGRPFRKRDMLPSIAETVTQLGEPGAQVRPPLLQSVGRLALQAGSETPGQRLVNGVMVQERTDR